MKEAQTPENPQGQGQSAVERFVRSSSDIFLDIPSIGVGRLRTSGAWILLMLVAESKGQREEIIARILTELDITPERIRKVMDDKGCPKCGMSLLMHEGRKDGKKGQCF